MKSLIIILSLFSLPISAELLSQEQYRIENFNLKSLSEHMDSMDSIYNVGRPPVLDCTNCKEDKPLPALLKEFKKNGAKCEPFIDEKGNYGPWGQVIVDYMREHRNRKVFYIDTLKGAEPPAEICPNWDNLDLREREHFWVWAFASIAWTESTCKENARNNKATNGIGIGLFQLDNDT